MKKNKTTAVLAAVVAGITLNVIGSDLKIIDMKPRTETLLYSGWTFYAGDNTAVKGDATPEGGRTVTIPHDWQIEKPAHRPAQKARVQPPRRRAGTGGTADGAAGAGAVFV